MADYLKIATAMLATRRWERLISPRDLAELLREYSDQQERELRKTLWLGHGCPISALYGDDGEMQCSLCRIDFSRMPFTDIARVLREAGTKRTCEWRRVPGSKTDWYGACKMPSFDMGNEDLPSAAGIKRCISCGGRIVEKG